MMENYALHKTEEQTNSSKISQNNESLYKSQCVQAIFNDTSEKYQHTLSDLLEYEDDFYTKENNEDKRDKTIIKHQPKVFRNSLIPKYKYFSHKKSGKLFSPEVEHPYSTLAEVRRQEQFRRRVSTGSYWSNSEYELGQVPWNGNNRSDSKKEIHRNTEIDGTSTASIDSSKL